MSYGYDARDRLTQLASNQTSVFEYDAESSLTRAYNSDADIYFYPDALGRDTAVEQNGKRVSYTYVPGMNLRASMRDPDGGVHGYTHDVLGRLTQITDPESGATTFSYDLDNLRTKRTQPHGVETNYSYIRGVLAQIEARQTGGTVYERFDYSYDGQGVRDTLSYLSGNEYGLNNDFQGQLGGATLKDGGGGTLYSSNFFYDGANNRTGGGDYTGYSYDAANRLTSTGSTSYGYDFDGNLTSESDGGSYTYSYDREGRLVSQSGPGGLSISYKYDPFGRRIEQNVGGTVTKFVYDGQHVLLDLNASNATVARYTYSARIDEVLSVRRGGATYYYLQDALGSVVRIQDSSRTTQNTYEYLVWGEIRAKSESVPNRFTYTGREQNPDGRTMHYRARTYLPHLGRFAQEDPLGFVDGVNLYRYVGNSPCAFVDPSGECLKETMRFYGAAALSYGAGRAAKFLIKGGVGLGKNMARRYAESGVMLRAGVAVGAAVGGFTLGSTGRDLADCYKEHMRVIMWDGDDKNER